MTWLKRAIVASVAALGIALFIRDGAVPDSPPLAQRECYRMAVRLSCAAAKAISRLSSDVPCTAGGVVIWAEVVVNTNRTEPFDVPAIVGENINPIEASAVPIACSSAKRPGKVITPLRWAEVPAAEQCIGGLVRKRIDDLTNPDPALYRTWPEPRACCGDGCECVSAPCVTCPPHELAGEDTCRARICEARPDLCPNG
jgi:hypothetical protein